MQNILTDVLSKIQVNSSSKMISLDINNMYTNIPIQETLDILENKFQQLHYDSQYSSQLIKLL